MGLILQKYGTLIKNRKSWLWDCRKESESL